MIPNDLTAFLAALHRHPPSGALAARNFSVRRHRSAFKEAAVLVGIVPDDAGAQLLLTRRTASLRQHGGQIAFPGGRQDPQDAGSHTATALREAAEEIGTPPKSWQTFPPLPPFYSPTGYSVRPVPALHTGGSWRASPDEVAEIFLLPLATALNPDAYRFRPLPQEPARVVPALPYRHYDIWGLTAAILYHIAQAAQAA